MDDRPRVPARRLWRCCQFLTATPEINAVAYSGCAFTRARRRGRTPRRHPMLRAASAEGVEVSQKTLSAAELEHDARRGHAPSSLPVVRGCSTGGRNRREVIMAMAMEWRRSQRPEWPRIVAELPPVAAATKRPRQRVQTAPRIAAQQWVVVVYRAASTRRASKSLMGVTPDSYSYGPLRPATRPRRRERRVCCQ